MEMFTKALVIAIFTTGMISHIANIGQERKPTTAGEASISTLVSVGILLLVIFYL